MENQDLLSRSVIAPLIRGSLFNQERYHFFSSLPSTNVQASDLAHRGAPEGTIVVADQQTEGRGRLGRVWESPPAVNLYFSIVLRPALPPQNAAQLTLITGLALAEAVAITGASPVEIKWPNDLLLGGRKLAGILTEMAADAGRVRYVIIGVGVNVNSQTAAFSPEVRLLATTLRDALQKPVKRSVLLANFMAMFEKWYRQYMEGGFVSVREAWLAKSGLPGRRVQINLLQECFAGVAVDLDPDGFLLVQRDDGTLSRVVAGDVTLLEIR